MSVYASPTRFGRAATMLRNEAERIGGRPPSLTAGIFASVVGTEAEARARGVHHMTSTYGLTEEQGARSVVAGMGQLRELVDDYVRAGATAIRFGGADAAADAWPTIAKEFLD